MRIKARSAARRFAFFGALTMIIGLGVASAASAAQVPIWTQNGTHLPFGTEVSFSGQSLTGLDLQWTQGGGHYLVECETLSASGKVEDYASGKAGTLKPVAVPPWNFASGVFKGCVLVEMNSVETVWTNSTCKVPKEIPVNYTTGDLTNSPYSTGGLKLSKVEMTFIISGCPQGMNEGIEWRFWGDVSGNEGHGAWPGEVLFPETPVSMNMSGSGATIEFGMNIHDGTPTPIKIAEDEIVAPHNPGHHYWYKGGAQRRGEGAQTLVAAGTPQAIKGNGGSLSIEGSLSGVKTKISCSGSTTTGSVENPAGGGDGTASVSFSFTGCTVPVPAGKSCYIEGGGFTTSTMPGVLQKAEAFAPLKLAGVGGGENIATVRIRGCTVSALNNNFPLTGWLVVSPYLGLSNPGMWFVDKTQTESTNLLKLGGNKANASGTLGAETTGGEAVTWTE
jgi:hypothetical protein